MNLEVTGLTCGYSPARPVVRDVSFSLGGGEVCCILGHNGAGKSTIFKTILKLIPPLAGKVCINGEDIAPWSPGRLACAAAYVAQSHTPPFPYLVEEMVMLGRMNRLGLFGSPGPADRAAVDSLLRDLDLEHLRKKPYTEVSGGERQLVMIAKALAQEPELLVLDEPTANLDYGNKIMVMDCIRGLAGRGITTVFTSHDPEHALLLDARTLMLIPGEPAVFGDAAQVVTERNLRRAYHAAIRVVEVVDAAGHPVRMCIPLLGQSVPEQKQK